MCICGIPGCEMSLEEAEQILEVIDDSWYVLTPHRDRVRELFLAELAKEDLNHPWVRRAAKEKATGA
jgi:hypothetical protein